MFTHQYGFSYFSQVLIIFRHIYPEQILSFRVRVELGAIAMKGYFTLARTPEKNPTFGFSLI